MFVAALSPASSPAALKLGASASFEKPLNRDRIVVGVAQQPR
jgi:hypothetical protein